MPAYTEYPQENIDKAIALAQRSVEGVDLRSADVLTPEMLVRVSPARFGPAVSRWCPREARYVCGSQSLATCASRSTCPTALRQRLVWTCARFGRASPLGPASQFGY